jgi:hypothetical protein
MSARFLSEFMQFALAKTGADRALAYDLDLQVVDKANFETTDLVEPKFQGIDYVQRALQSGELLVTNNAVNDPTKAPTTNTNFSNLRVVVIIPLKGMGAIYLDHPIRRGIIPKGVIMRLGQTVNACVASDSSDFETTYASIP